MKFMQALDKLQEGHTIAVYRDEQPNRLVKWDKTAFKDFYSNKVILISKEDLFADDWDCFDFNKED